MPRVLTDPHMYPRSRRDILTVFELPAVSSSWMISSGDMPTLATPLRMPTVAGTPPFTRTTDSSTDDSAILSGYGKPDHVSSANRDL